MPQVSHTSVRAIQPHAFHELLPRYVNGGCLSRRDRVCALVYSGLPFLLNARRVTRQFELFKEEVAALPARPSKTVEVATYEGHNPHVFRMTDYLAKHLWDDLLEAYVHGSLGTHEAVPYSDFDALVILKNEVFSSPRRLARAARKLDKARSFMLQFDPLQHHGWFVLAEAQLSAYPEFYFPSALFGYAKALLPERGRALTLCPVDRPALQERQFLNLSGSVIGKIERGNLPRDLYELKFLLSQFMLLPAMYVQSRDSRGVYKKYSFDLARRDFPEEDWRVMDEVSTIREYWEPTLTRAQRWLLTRRNKSFRQVTRRFAPAIPKPLQRVLTESFYRRMQKLALLMQQELLHQRIADGHSQSARAREKIVRQDDET